MTSRIPPSGVPFYIYAVLNFQLPRPRSPAKSRHPTLRRLPRPPRLECRKLIPTRLLPPPRSEQSYPCCGVHAYLLSLYSYDAFSVTTLVSSASVSLTGKTLTNSFRQGGSVCEPRTTSATSLFPLSTHCLVLSFSDILFIVHLSFQFNPFVRSAWCAFWQTECSRCSPGG